jgi:ion channel-forming bestrophin family protein
MIVNLQIPWLRILRELKVVLIIIILYMTSISILDHFTMLEEIHVPMSIITVPGTVIALLLGFRTNSAYDRWWEARIIWGAIVNDSRTWVRQLMSFITLDEEKSSTGNQIERMCLRQVAWNYALSRNLRKQNPLTGLEGLISKQEIEQLKNKHNIPNALLYIQAENIRDLREKKLIDAYQFVELDRTLTKLTDSMGRCERIKNTVFPSSYSLMVDLLIYIWILFLPFGLVEIIGYILIPTTVSMAFSFLIIDRIAVYMQDPFENLPSDTPMSTLAKTIEINIKQELKMKNIPEPDEPINGVLM